MKKSVKELILKKIITKKHGWAFSASDFLKKFERNEIDKALSTLASDGDIRRLGNGIYDYALYSKTLNRRVAPDINQVAQAFARKFCWTICPTGNTALNYLGLSTQVLGKAIYLSSGASKKYIIDSIPLEFKHAVPKEIAIKNKNALLVVQAIKAIGKDNISEEFTSLLASKFTYEEWQKMYDSSSTVTAWVYQVIKDVKNYKEANNNG